MPYQSFFMNCVYKSCVRKCVLQQFRPCVKTWPMGLSRKQVPASEILMCSAGITGGCREDDGLPWTCRFTVFNQFRTFPTSPSAVSFFSFRIQPWSFWGNLGLVLSRGQWARSLTSPLMLPRVGSKGPSRFLERSSTETALKQWRRSTRKKGNRLLLQYACKARGLLKRSCLSALMRASVGLPRLGLYLRRSVEYMASCARPHSNEMLAQCPATTVLLQRGTTIQYTRCLLRMFRWTLYLSMCMMLLYVICLIDMQAE